MHELCTVYDLRMSSGPSARAPMHLLWQLGSRITVDETGGIESLMNRNFERAGYVVSAPTAWLSTEKAVRIEVPCAPLGDYLDPLGVRRIDIFWLDVEGVSGHARVQPCRRARGSPNMGSSLPEVTPSPAMAARASPPPRAVVSAGGVVGAALARSRAHLRRHPRRRDALQRRDSQPGDPGRDAPSWLRARATLRTHGARARAMHCP